MPVTLPNPLDVAREEAAVVKRYQTMIFDGLAERVLQDCPFVDAETLLSGLEAFHRERMARVPSSATYPEAPPWVEHVLAVDRELQALTGMTDRQMALYRSLWDYLTFRGYARAKPAMTERCRIIYLPDTDQGEFHIKNVDDPITFYQPDTEPPTHAKPVTGLMWDGVGSGLHIDDEPEEIFPLPYYRMCMTYCDDVPGAVQFLTRYSPFWGGGNVVLYDAQQRNVAIEKCSRNFIEVFQPGANGGSHCSGLACRDPQSPQGQYQAKKQLEYLIRFNQPLDGTDMTYWKACNLAEEMLGNLMKKPKPTVAEILELFLTPWPKGLNKPGTKVHPGQSVGEYTLVTRVHFYSKGICHRYQRDAFGNYPCAPEVYTF
ncbi:MAG: hypothetical protein ACYC6A_20145 [Armatimonadota bacterium]